MPYSRGKKILIGCLAVLALAAIVVVVTVVMFFRWLQAPGEPLEGNRLVDADTRIYLEFNLAEEDPGSRNLIRALVQAQRTLQTSQRELPSFLRWLNSVNQQDITDEELDELLPIGAILSRQAEEADLEGGSGFVVNLPSAANGLRLFDWLFAMSARRSPDIEYLEYRDEAYYRLRDDGKFDIWMSVVDSNLAFALRETPVRSAIDRLQRTPEMVSAETAPLAPLLTSMPDDSVVRVASIDSQTAALLDLIATPLPELSALLDRLVGDSRMVQGWLQVESPDVLVGEFQADTGLSSAESPTPVRVGDVLTLELYDRHLRVTLEPIHATQTGWSAWRLRAAGVLDTVRVALEDAASDSSRRIQLRP